MEDYILMTDSTADVPSDICARLNIEVIPMDFDLEDKTYTHYPDGREMNYQEFYTYMKQGKKAVTSQINYDRYYTILSEFLKQGKDILYIVFSSGLSGTYNTSQIAIKDLLKEYPERKIISIDSLSASVGETLLVYNAALKKKKGIGMEELAEWVKENCSRTCHWFVVDDLEHLKRGGRISSVQAALGKTLNIKPFLSIDDEGKLISVSKIRGKKRVYDAFVERLVRDGRELKDQIIVIGQGDNMTDATALSGIIKEKNLVKDVIITDIGPIIGTHTGAGVMAMAFLGERNYKN